MFSWPWIDAMVREDEIRAAERAIEWPDATDAGLIFIGRIRTPWTSRMDCPRQGRHDGPTCRIEIFETWTTALEAITDYDRLEILYWLHRSRRDLICKVRAMTAKRAALSPCARRCGRIRSEPPSLR